MLIIARYLVIGISSFYPSAITRLGNRGFPAFRVFPLSPVRSAQRRRSADDDSFHLAFLPCRHRFAAQGNVAAAGSSTQPEMEHWSLKLRPA